MEGCQAWTIDDGKSGSIQISSVGDDDVLTVCISVWIFACYGTIQYEQTQHNTNAASYRTKLDFEWIDVGVGWNEIPYSAVLLVLYFILLQSGV